MILCRYRLSSGTDEEMQLASLVGIFVKLRSMMKYDCLFQITNPFSILMQSGVIHQGPAVVEDTLGNTIHERFYEYLCKFVFILKF